MVALQFELFKNSLMGSNTSLFKIYHELSIKKNIARNCTRPLSNLLIKIRNYKYKRTAHTLLLSQSKLKSLSNTQTRDNMLVFYIDSARYRTRDLTNGNTTKAVVQATGRRRWSKWCVRCSKSAMNPRVNYSTSPRIVKADLYPAAECIKTGYQPLYVGTG